MEPDFERLRTVLTRHGEPDRVPLGDIGVHPILKQKTIGRPIRDLADEVEFWAVAGFDHVPIEQGLQLTDVVRRQSMHELESNYAVETADVQSRSWATEGKGLIATRAEFDAFDWPNPDDFDYTAFDRAGKLLSPNVKITAVLGKLFTCVWWLMGFEGLSMALADEPDLVADMFRKVGEIQSRVLDNMLQFDSVGLIWHADDIAYSNQTMINPRVLRAHHFPWYREMNAKAHAAGRLVIYHSDGALQQVLDDVVACEFDGLNPIEPKAMDIVDVKRKYGDRISILGNIDLGYTLTLGTPREVEAEVRERIRVLAPGGGYAVASSNSVPEYVPLANFNAMREATLEYGRYPIRV